MSIEKTRHIVDCMATNVHMRDVQFVQTEHRLKLVEFWGIREGSRVLEIGCGQGDTTAVLAYLVGDRGFVHGVDIAPPSYGSPITVGDAAEYLMKSKLGKQIRMEFELDVLASEVDFPENSFDYVVLSHCSWYLKSADELQALLEKTKKWAKQLCFAEWDPRLQNIEQYPHFLAVHIQAQYECFKENSFSNVRTLFTPKDLTTIAESAGWTINDEQSISSTKLQDGKWEVDMTLSDYQKELEEINHMPLKLKELIKSEVNLLEEAVKNYPSLQSLSTFVFSAR
ncbi:class I SAM-dependent methyltransferase [Paenisporosarcina sp. FSL H8-0542]|uniref:class I SAM-dependent methyltransferase n=1 Tax=Paenisporosarcina sp. FSL H8-0542 TaxID=2921401 RepID=UPI00315B1D2B